MAKKYLLGIDLGTSATKAGLYDLDGRLIAETSLEVPLYTPSPGVVEQETEDFYQTAAVCTKRCLQESSIEPRQVAGLAFDSQMAGIGTVDEDFLPVTRFDSWLDMRCQPYIESMDRQAGHLITRLTGCPPTCNHGPKMLWWKNERPGEYARIARFVTPAGYVAGRAAGLRGSQAFMDYTFIHFSGFSDAQAGTWSRELCSQFKMEMDKLPEIVEPWQMVGEISDQAANDFGLVAGTPVAAGCGDTAASALGAGIVRPGMLFDVAGTAAVLAGCTDRFVVDEGQRALLTMRSVIPGLWHPLAYIAGGGLALRWFRDQFFNTRRAKPLVLENNEDLYEALCLEAAAIPPGSEGLLFSPHLGGRICPAAPDMRGAWIGFSWGHTQAHFFRAILESVALEYAYYLQILKELLPGLNLVEARVTGGGASSPVWNAIKADILNVPYQPSQRKELSAWGAALIAGKAAGLFGDLAQEAEKQALPAGMPVLPNISNREIYDRLTRKYIALQQMLRNFS